MFDPNYLSPEFQTAAAGYLRTHAVDLPRVLASLPAANSDRERGIVAAMIDGVRNPSRWERNRAPIKLRRTPEEAMALPSWERAV
jgi:hypothetical protein